MHDEQTPFESPAEFPAEAPPTEAGDFVPVTPPEGWPTVIGVLSIIFGSLSVIGGLCGFVSLLFVTVLAGVLPQEMRDEMQIQSQASMPYPLPQGVQMIAEFGIAIVLLVGGIMLVKRNRKSGGVLRAFACLDLVANTYGAVLGYFVLGASIAAMKEDPEMQPAAPLLDFIQSIGGELIWVGLVWVLSAIWPVFLLLWFRRAKTRESMDSWGDGPTDPAYTVR